MQINLTEFKISDKNELVSLLISERWEFHSMPRIPKEKVIERLESGYYKSTENKTFWITDDKNNKAGFIRLFDLGDDINSSETPLFDIRIKKEFRGKGIGKQAVKWLTEYVFTNFPNKNRLEANTRYDNIVMRSVLEKCGFVKEAHYRQGWPDEYGNKYDCVGYCILKRDWETKTLTPVNWSG